MVAMNAISRVSAGGGLAGRLRRAAAGLLDAWLPASCIVCDRPRSDRLCDDCEAGLPGVRAARCPRCALVLPVPGGAAPARCAACDVDPPAFAATVVLADYAAPLDHRLLLRTRSGAPAATLHAAERRAALAGAFATPRALAGRSVIVVDDVMTTGATLRAAAEALRDAGAGPVINCVVARTPQSDASRDRQRRPGPS